MDIDEKMARIISRTTLLDLIKELPDDAKFVFCSFVEDKDGGEWSRIRHSSTIGLRDMYFAGHWISDYAMRQYRGDPQLAGETPD